MVNNAWCEYCPKRQEIYGNIKDADDAEKELMKFCENCVIYLTEEEPDGNQNT